MGQCGPHEHFSATCLGITMALRIAATWDGSSVFTVGVGVGTGVGGIGQSFLVSNRFSDAYPELGQGVLCLEGTLSISSSGAGCDSSFWDLVVGCGTSANCPIASLYTITGIDSAVDLTNGVWVLTVATMGAGVVKVGVEGVDWVSTLTLYLLLVTMVLLLSLILGPGAFLTMGLVLGWAGCRFVLTGFGVGAWTLDQVSLLTPNMFSSSR